ncbi:MAG TPA: 2-oxoacid:acceptor oxidoreductase subunit alpha [Dehalococcoidia bacterium]|nr:2-oxoacid:acceptor oxidoreductase subunit alpha [Dehalococcoidia bacterium]
MTQKAPAVLTGRHFMNGDVACAEGALAAGCTFFAGYPITPSTEIAERMAQRLPEVGGIYIQMEDELASMNCVLGAAWAGRRAMTATSGPGFTLMQENIGLGIITETPCVVVNVQRGGPSTGLPTLPGQADVMQAKWGSHGDYEVIAYAPASPQEMFDLTVKAFNAADTYRLPVFVLADEVVGHMTERVVIPDASAIPRAERPQPPFPPGEGLLYQPLDGALVPPMPPVGEGYAIHATGLTHDERGYPATSAEVHDRLVRRLRDKILRNADRIIEYEEYLMDDADVCVVSFGSSARSARHAVNAARKRGIRAGLLRLITVWPFPGSHIAVLSERVKAFVVAELNLGQVETQVQRFSTRPVLGAHHGGGEMLTPEAVLNAIEEAS